MTQQEIPIMKQVVKVLDLRPLMREYIDRERVKNNLISRLLGRLKENAIKNESLIGQDLGIVPTLSVESKKILQIEIFSVEKLEKKNILEVVSSKVSDIITMALPFNESVRTEVPLNPVPVSDQLVNSLTDQSLIKQAAQNIETAVVDIVGNCFAFGKNKTLNFQADLLAFNPKWIHEKPSLRSFIEMTENSSDITKRNLCSWIVIWAEGRQAYHTPGVVDCINNFTKKSNPEACLRPFYSLDFDKIKTLPNSTIEELRTSYPKETDNIALLKHVMNNHPEVGETLVKTEKCFVMYVIDWTKIWQCQNPGQSLDLAIQSGTAIVDTDNFISLLIEKSPISYDSTVLRWIADFVRERDPNYVISWPDVLGPEGQLDNEQKALLKEGSGAIPGPAETKSMGKIVSEGVNQPAFKIGGMYILYSFAINFPNLIYLAIALWLLKNFKDFFEENSAGNGGNDGNDGNDGSGGSGGHGNKGTGNSDGDDKGGTKGPKASKKDDDNKDNKDKDDESRDSNKKRGSRWGFSVRGNPFVTVDPITGQQSFQFRFPSSEAEPTENPIPRFRPRSPKPFTFEPNHPVEVVVQDAESQESEFGRDSVTSTPTYKNSQQKQKRDF